jgi:hypothetical protein
MDPIVFLHRLVVPLLLCSGMGIMVCSTPAISDGSTAECIECPVPSGEQEEVKDIQTCPPLSFSHMSIGTPRVDPECSTDERLLPSPYGEVLVRPPKGSL